MSLYAGSELAMEPVLDVAAIATIVRELMAGGPARLAESHWLSARTEAAGLSVAASEALEALRVHLVTGGATLRQASTFLQW